MRFLCFALVITFLSPAYAQPSTDPIRQVEVEIIRRVNELRRELGLDRLTEYRRMTHAAQGHSLDMLEHGYFAHRTPTKSCGYLTDRLRRFRCQDLTVGENIYKSVGYRIPELANKAMTAWINSPAHYRNLIKPDYNRIGVGVRGDGDTYLFTQVFASQFVEIEKYRIEEDGREFNVSISGIVHKGQPKGAFFLGGKKLGSWKADSKGHFESKIHSKSPGLLDLAQATGGGKYRIEAELELGDHNPNHK